MTKFFGTLALAVALAGGLTIGATPAAAQDEEGATTYDFEDDLVTGDLVRPDGEVLQVRKRGQRQSLIRIRDNFLPEMLKSVEDL